MRFPTATYCAIYATVDVLVLDDDEELCEVTAEFINMLGSTVVSLRGVADLIALDDRVHDFDLAILDVNLGPARPSGLDAYHWLKEMRFSGKIVFLTGHARNHPLVAEAYRIGDAEVVQKPYGLARLRALLEPKHA